MTELTLIQQVAHERPPYEETGSIILHADRLTLAKRRWRGRAEDGREFGFDLPTPLGHGTCFFIDGTTRYVVIQEPEAVLEIPVSTVEEAAAIAWQIGNLHLGAQVLPALLRVVDDPAAVQLLERGHIAFQRRTEVFLPLTGAHHHAHD